MKKTIIKTTVFLLLACFFCINCKAIDTSAQSAVVIDGDKGIAVYEKDAHTRRGMASTTKIMTAIVAIESCPLDKIIKINDAAVGVEGSSIYLKRGEKLTMKELLYALLLQSANDAAAAIAYEVGGSIEGFAQMMNDKSDELGLKDTHFTNPHGLYDEDHYTTAYELALITKHALNDPTFREIVSTKKTIIPLNNGEGSRVLVNHNKMLNTYTGAIGVKTGFTKKTGRCLVSAAENDGTTVIAVTLNAPSDWSDHTKMLDLGFENVKTVRLASKDQYNCKVAVVGGNCEYITVTNKGELKYTCLTKDLNVTSEIIMDHFLFAPIKKNEVVGHVVFYNSGEEIGRVELVSQDSIDKKIIKKKLFGIF